MPSTDRATLAGQYRDAANLNARIALHERFSTNRLDLHRWLFDQIALPARARLLELGCGPGTIWAKNLDRLPPGWRMVLTDASAGMVREAARALAASKRPVDFAVADARAIPVADLRVDAVVAHFMLYHVPDRSRALAEVARVLAPGGTLYAATNGRRHMREAKAFAARAGLIDERAAGDGDAPGFNLENGRAQLAPRFAAVELRRREDALVVTEVEPLLAWLLSRSDVQASVARLGPDLAARQTAVVRSTLATELATHGAIRVTKDSGLFVARSAAAGSEARHPR